MEIRKLVGNKKFDTFCGNVENGINQMVFGLNSELKGLFLAETAKGGVFVSKDLASSTKIAQMTSAAGLKSRFITTPFENALGLVDNSLKADFVAAINEFSLGEIDLIITSPDALFQKIPNPKNILNSILVFEKDGDYDLNSLAKTLTEKGYTRTEFVSAKGQFTLKGDTLQIYPIASENIYKLEFFDTQLEKISEISADEKKFVKNIEKLKIYDLKFSADTAKNQLDKDFFNLLDLSDKIFFDEPKQIYDIAKNYAEIGGLKINFESALKTNASITAFSSIVEKTFFTAEDFLNFTILQPKNYVYDFKEMLRDVKYHADCRKDVYLFCKNEKNKEILEHFFSQQFLTGAQKEHIHITEDFLPYSANLLDSDCVLIGTYDLFKKEKSQLAKTKKSLFTPKIGEYVVHETHGVGKCVGFEKMSLNGALKDYFILEYAGGDRFYLPSEQADMLSSYHTSESAPKLNKLGGVEFAKIKEKVYKNVKELAFDLVKLYAKREKAKGFVYSKDDYLMEQFENAFPYDETADQARAIADIKADMESERVMDRLICGDVGFGKTEVALRAIYKAILSGKQVAFLCPTTILSQQHYQTCQNRFSGFMVKIARFNRLIKKSEEKDILAGLENGEINLVCGTHKLLSDKVKFKNLGLLVLDEEQRFGVEDKEKIKNLKCDIDVLSLSATPIPRTLHMSLSGIRDISIIDTPPKERQPVQTFVTPFSEEILVEASKQELARNGQILIIYNRIDTIYEFASFVQRLLPSARIGVTHGRLSQKALEDSILKLYAHEYDILISTTLIENGINLPTANTLIVIDADKLGLSQLYQIRGRIGRSNRTAFAYLTFSGDKKLTDDAYNRLSALMENTALGSGYKIALADLDIRGAGNVLGKEQHGNMLKVGYDLYYKLLHLAVKEVKGEKANEAREVKLDIAIDAFVPESYIGAEDERIKLISEVSDITSQENIDSIRNNLIGLYGKPPKEVENLLSLGLVKHNAQNAGARRIVLNSRQFVIYFYDKKEKIIDNAGSVEENIKMLLSGEVFQVNE